MIELNIIKNIEDKTGVIHLEGDLDQPNAKAFLDNMLNMIEDNNLTHLVIDLNSLSFLDSLGLGALIKLQKKVEADGGAMALVCWKDAVLKVFEMSGLWSPSKPKNRVRIVNSVGEAKNFN
jgi:anti-anti-sigma factor